jgi:hypothetical protein
MRIMGGSDERTYVTDALLAELRQRGHKLLLVGPLMERWNEVLPRQYEPATLAATAGIALHIRARLRPGLRLCRRRRASGNEVSGCMSPSGMLLVSPASPSPCSGPACYTEINLAPTATQKH